MTIKNDVHNRFKVLKRTYYKSLKALFFMFCLHYALLLSAQEASHKEMLLSQIDSTSKISKKVQLYADIAWEYIIEENDSALIFANKAISISKKNDYPLGQAMGLETKGVFYEVAKGSYGMASKFYYEGIAICQANNLDYEASIYHSLGVMFHTSDNYEKAFNYYSKALDLAQKKGAIDLEKKCLINMGAVQSSLKNFDKAAALMKASIEIPIRPELDYSTYANLGYLYVKQGQFKQALAYLEKAIAQTPENPDSEIHLYFYINAKVKARDSTNMAPIIERAKRAINTVGIRDKSLLLRHIADYYTLIKDYENALKYRDAYIVVYEDIKEKQRDQTVLDLEAKYQLQQKDFEIERQSNSKKWLLWLLGAALLILGCIVWFYVKIKQKNTLLDQQKSLLEKAVDDKSTLLKEIHHRVKNSLQMVASLLFLQAENIDDKKAKVAIKDAQNRVRSLGLIHQKLYSKSYLKGVETESYIKELTTDIFNSHQLESQDLNPSLDIESMVLSIETLSPIGLVLTELIINVLKHAFTEESKDPKLAIKFFSQKDTLVLSVMDNGVGYKEKTKEKSFGLKLIRSLATRLDADFTIQATQPKGTEAKLIIHDFEIITGL